MEEPEFTETKKLRQVRSAAKTMLIVFFDAKWVVHREFEFPNGRLLIQISTGRFCDVCKTT